MRRTQHVPSVSRYARSGIRPADLQNQTFRSERYAVRLTFESLLLAPSEYVSLSHFGRPIPGCLGVLGGRKTLLRVRSVVVGVVRHVVDAGRGVAFYGGVRGAILIGDRWYTTARGRLRCGVCQQSAPSPTQCPQDPRVRSWLGWPLPGIRRGVARAVPGRQPVAGRRCILDVLRSLPVVGVPSSSKIASST